MEHDVLELIELIDNQDYAAVEASSTSN